MLRIQSASDPSLEKMSSHFAAEFWRSHSEGGTHKSAIAVSRKVAAHMPTGRSTQKLKPRRKLGGPLIPTLPADLSVDRGVQFSHGSR